MGITVSGPRQGGHNRNQENVRRQFISKEDWRGAQAADSHRVSPDTAMATCGLPSPSGKQMLGRLGN